MLPFLFEVLGDDSTPDKAAIAEQLEYVLEEVARMQPATIVIMRRYVAIYDSFKDHLPLLMRLLEGRDEALRLAGLNLLRHMHDDSGVIAPFLLELLQGERSEAESLRMLQTLRALWGPRHTVWLYANSALLPLLQNLIEGHTSPLVRTAAARAATFFSRAFEGRNAELLQTTSALLAREFFAQTVMFEREDPGADHTRRLLADILRLPNAQSVLLELLGDPAISAEQAHLAGSALIASAYLTGYLWYETSYKYSPGKQGFVYRHQAERETFLPDHVKPGLARLVEVDAFWAVPSNLLSFCYGLPDDRAELQALLEEQ
jgi:hypothetical protein